jgi:hypothetical protein
MRERPSLFKRTDEVIPELEQLDVGPSGQPDVQPAKQSRVKRTFYLTPEASTAVDEMQLDALKKTGKKPELSDIVSQAILTLKRQNMQTSEHSNG